LKVKKPRKFEIKNAYTIKEDEMNTSATVKGGSTVDKKIVSISSKRQITIPQKFFAMLGFSDEAECIVRGNELVIRPARQNAGGEFAEQILAGDSDDVSANFAMGMGCLIEKKYLRARKHLEKCLSRRPDEPAVLNNLAVVELRLGRTDLAEEYALKALKLYPDSLEIKSTLRHIQAARPPKN
jgi:tetratricopeptide (TPR) repeat protein